MKTANQKTKSVKVVKVCNHKEYLDGLIEITKRIERAQIEKNPQQINSWFNYLMGYIKAIDESLTS